MAFLLYLLLFFIPSFLLSLPLFQSSFLSFLNSVTNAAQAACKLALQPKLLLILPPRAKTPSRF